MTAVRIMLVEDHIIVREGLKALLATDDEITVVAEAGDAQEAYEKAMKHRPHVILMDIALPGTDGIGATLKIKQEFPDIHIVMLTMHVDEKLIKGAVGAGASGYLLKSISREELVSTIHALHKGQIFLPSDLTKIIVGMAEINTAGKDITVREMEALMLLKRGFTNKEIAQHLCISGSTVKTHLSNMFAKLGVNNRQGAVRKAVRSGLFDSYE
jgi:DNA-binding NarL/FixJ family response regulator